MAFNLKNRSFITLLDFSTREIEYLIDLASSLKIAHVNGTEQKLLIGKTIALIFEKPSTRTRCAFEVAAFHQGAHVSYLGSGTQIGVKESMKDTARVLGRMYDAIEYRGSTQKNVESLVEFSGVPVWNGLTNEFHPTQILADMLTIREHLGVLKGKKLVFYGDARNNMGNSLMIGCAKLGMHFVSCSPEELWPDQALVKECRDIAKITGGSIDLEADPIQGAEQADVVYTDVWVSMGDPDSVWKERVELLKPYQVSAEILKICHDNVIFMHCLPAFHNLETKVGHEKGEKFHMTSFEVSDFVFESKYSVVFDQAENRLHTIKAVMVATLGS